MTVSVNGAGREFAAGASVADAVAAVTAAPTGIAAAHNAAPTGVGAAHTAAPTGIAAAHNAAPTGVAVALNAEVVPRGEWPTTPLRDGDHLEILTAAQGG
ncbi:MAG: sulfur carrier protein ThiS [Micromonosporaceae bacterium]